MAHCTRQNRQGAPKHQALKEWGNILRDSYWEILWGTWGWTPGRLFCQLCLKQGPSMCSGASLVGQLVKNLPVMQETRFDSRVGKIPWSRKWQPTPVFLPGESPGQRSLAGYSPWVTRVGHDSATKPPQLVLNKVMLEKSTRPRWSSHMGSRKSSEF